MISLKEIHVFAFHARLNKDGEGDQLVDTRRGNSLLISIIIMRRQERHG